MDEIIFYVEDDKEGGFTAKSINYSIFTEGDTVEELRKNILDAVDCHFEESEKPKMVRLHFVHQELLELA